MKSMIQQRPAQQQGIVLVVALLILMVMTVIGTSMLSTATMEERMANNLQTSNAAFQAANSCFKDTINTPPGQDYSITLSNAINDMNNNQFNQCDDPAAPGTDLYGTALDTQAIANASSTQPFQPRGYELSLFKGVSVPISVTANLANASTSVTLQITGGVIIPQ
ncbi:MAG: PilX N-terminal domain-containing pilus assembly protein [Gammaproteobacteria bacterium]|nr:PilX N-terminal domain-containing pilus assembly protein [Gammaproteobacteria bacterium]